MDDPTNPTEPLLLKRRKIFLVLLLCVNVIIWGLSINLSFELPEMANLSLNPDVLQRAILEPLIQDGSTKGLIRYTLDGEAFLPGEDFDKWVQENPVYLAFPEGKIRQVLPLFSLAQANPNLNYDIQITLDTRHIGRGAFGYGILETLYESILQHGDSHYLFQGGRLVEIFEGPTFQARWNPGGHLTRDGETLIYRTLSGTEKVFQPFGENRFLLREHRDSWGGALRFEYNETERLSMVKDNLGREIRIQWNTNGLVESLRMQEAVYRLQYDTRDNCTALTTPQGKVLEFKRGNAVFPHRISRMTDESGKTYDLEYGILGRLETIKTAGRQVQLQYGKNAVNAIWPGHRIRVERSAPLQWVVRKDDTTMTYDFNPDGQVLNYKDAYRNMEFTYDARGNLIRRVGQGKTTEFFHDADTNILIKQVEDGQVLFEKVIENGLVASKYQSGLGRIEFRYDQGGRATEMRLEGIGNYRFDYDVHGLPVAVHTPGDTSSRFLWSNQELSGWQAPFGTHLKMTYDPGGQINEILHPGGYANFNIRKLPSPAIFLPPTTKLNVQSREDGAGRVILSDRAGRPVRLNLDPLRRVISVQVGDTPFLTYDFNDHELLSGMRQSDGRWIVIRPGPQNRAAQYMTSNGQHASLEFDPQSPHRVRQVATEKELRRYQWDDQNRIRSITLGTILEYRFQYSPNRPELLYNLQYPDGTRTAYEYDNDGRVLSITYQNTPPIRFRYPDPSTREIRFPNGIVQYEERDTEGRLTALNVTDAENRNLRDSSWSYQNGRVTSGMDQGRRFQIEYDPTGRITRYQAPPLTDLRYQWDDDSEIRKVESLGDGHTLQFRFIPEHRTLAILDSKRADNITALDIEGIIIGQRLNFLEVNARGQIIQDTDKFRYNNLPVQPGRNRVNLKGFLVSGAVIDNNVEFQLLPDASTTIQFDAGGQPKWRYALNRPEYFEFSFFNQLVSYRSREGREYTYHYLPNGQRASATVENRTVIHAYDPHGNLIETLYSSGKSLNRYFYDPLSHRLLMANLDGEIRFYHTDAAGSIVGISNADGRIINEYQYGPYGEYLARKEVVRGNTIGFLGMMLDPETGLYWSRHGHFDPEYLRFYPSLYEPIADRGGTALFNLNRGIHPGKRTTDPANEALDLHPIPHEVSFEAELGWIDYLPYVDPSIRLLREYLSHPAAHSGS